MEKKSDYYGYRKEPTARLEGRMMTEGHPSLFILMFGEIITPLVVMDKKIYPSFCLEVDNMRSKALSCKLDLQSQIELLRLALSLRDRRASGDFQE